MGDKQRSSRMCQPVIQENLLERFTGNGIQRGERLIQQQDRRLNSKGPGDRHPLLLPPAQGERVAAGELSNPH
ncbi:hypothetical protein D3C86_1963840 [compost metagenome]